MTTKTAPAPGVATTPCQQSADRIQIELLVRRADELSDDLLERVAGGMLPPRGDLTYWGEEAFWDPYFP